MLLMPVLGVENILVVYGKAHLVAVYVLISRAFMIACVVLPVVVFDAGVSGCGRRFRPRVAGHMRCRAEDCRPSRSAMYLR